MKPFETLSPMDKPESYMYWVDMWNDRHCECLAFSEQQGHNAKQSAEFRNNRMADWLEHILPQAKTLYYKSGKSPIGDDRFDQFEGYLKDLRPNSKYFNKVGYELKFPTPPSFPIPPGVK